MVILSYKPIQDFIATSREAKPSLNEWFEKCETSQWVTYHQMKRTFNSVDAIGNDRYIFNVGGNKYRVIAMIHFRVRTMYIKWVGTHKEYENVDPLTVNDY
jgi:mRNA interferase HigB